MSEKQDTMHSVASGVAKGLITGVKVCYCIEQDQFYLYEYGVWKPLFEIELLAIISEWTDYSYINNCTIARRKQILENLKLLVKKRLECFNTHNRLNFDLGEFDPATGIMHDHTMENYSTIRLAYPYDCNAKCELWLKTLLEIFENNQSKLDSLQEFFGYCLTKDTTQIMALLLLGNSKSGKSTILHVLRNMIGSINCSSVPMKFISNPQYTPLLINKLVNIDADVSENAKDFEFEFKIITSGEPVSCNQKFIPTFEFFPHCKIVMAANKFPRITDHSSAFFNRLIILPCERIFLPNEQNRALKVLLLEELSGIFNWAFLGLQSLNKRGMFEEKDFIKEAIEELREESNPVDIFFKENIEIDLINNSEITKEDLYEKYKEWCVSNGNAPMANNKFGQTVYLKYSKYTPKNTMSHRLMKRVWKNLRYINGPQEGESIQWQEK